MIAGDDLFPARNVFVYRGGELCRGAADHDRSHGLQLYLTRANAETEQWMSEYEVADEKAKICGQQLRSAQYRNQQLLAQIKARGGEPDTDVKLPDDWDGFADW